MATEDTITRAYLQPTSSVTQDHRRSETRGRSTSVSRPDHRFTVRLQQSIANNDEQSDTSETLIEIELSLPSTSNGQLPIQGHNNADYIAWFYSKPLPPTPHEPESHMSDTSYLLSGHSDSSSSLDVVDTATAMNHLAVYSSTNSPEDRISGFVPMEVDGNSDPAGAGGLGSRNIRGTSNSNTARGRGRGRGPVRGRGQAASRGRGGTSRSAKRPRTQDENNPGGDDDDGEYAPGAKKRKGNDREKRAPVPEPESRPTEVGRRRTSLRDRLIKGDYEPQPIGMRAYKMKQAAAAAAAAAAAGDDVVQASPAPVSARQPPREFLVPIEPRLEAATAPAYSASSFTSGNDIVNVQHNPRIAYKSTPMHQLHFPEDLLLAIKQNALKWEAKEHALSSVFVVARIAENDIADMHVFTTLRDATVDALHMMAREHPEAFASSPGSDDDGNEIKQEISLPTSAMIQQILARPDFQQVPFAVDQSNAGTSDADGNSVFVIKSEDPEVPPPSRIADPRPDSNSRGELLLRDAPEPTYVYCGSYKISSFGLKMEARRADGAAVKVSVHLKNLRKPTDT
ncbi:hypothetical protein F5Y01DRAFT_327359 [Xylaria sp. FL0043]|nr:hypothetical protein F5Y01DRAFT_327359 [Xylaria sp. FL0043]